MKFKFHEVIDKRWGVAFIVAAGLLWGTSGVFVTYLSEYGFTSIQMTATRSGVSALILLVYSLLQSRACFRVSKREIPVHLLLAVTLFFSCYLYYTSMVRTSVATAVSLLNMHPVYVTVISAIVYRERVSLPKIGSILAMVIGGCLVSGIVGGLEIDPVGILFGLLSGVSYACYILICKYYNGKNMSASSANLYSFVFMAIIAVSLCEPADYLNRAITNALPAIPLLIGLAICTFVVPFVLNGMALKALPAGTVSALSVFEPFSATVYSVLLFGEELEIAQIVGIALILGAAVLLGIMETRTDADGDGVSAESVGDLILPHTGQ